MGWFFVAGLRRRGPGRGPLASSWTPESRVSTPESTRQDAVIAELFMDRRWIPTGVDSQKNRSAASDAPGLAPQHTFSPGKEPENNGLEVWLSPVRLPVDPKNRRHPRTPSTACRSSFEPSGPRSGFRFGLWGPPRNPSRNRLRWRSSARASPEHTQFIHSGTCFCPFEKCPADTFLSRTIPYAAPASLITSCFDRLRLNRRLLRRSEMTESP